MKKMAGTKAGAAQMTHEFNQQAHPLLPSLQIRFICHQSYTRSRTYKVERNKIIKIFYEEIGGAVAVGISYSAHIVRLPSSPKLVITFRHLVNPRCLFAPHW